MFFWVGLAVVLAAFVLAVGWASRGLGGRFHEPGTQYMFRNSDAPPTVEDQTDRG